MSKKGQAGIGTLITFIAMIIVASITANVLIQTATSLQNQALKTGKQAQESISTLARVIGVMGFDGRDNTLEDFEMELKLSPGSNGIDLRKALLSLDLQDGGLDLTYTNNSCIKNLATGYFSDANNKNGTFAVKYLVKGSNWKNGYLQNGDIIELCFTTNSSMGQDEELGIRFVPQVGIPTIVEITTDEAIITQNVKLYP
jgi:flagellin-like protein